MSDYLIHYGVLGMKWGVRHDRPRSGRFRASRRPGEKPTNPKRGLSDHQKKILKYGAIAVGSALLAYGGYKLYKNGVISKNTISAVKDVAVNDVAKTKVKPAAAIASKIKPIPQRCNFNSFAAAISGGDFKISLKLNSEYVGNVTELLEKGLKSTEGRLFDTIPERVYTDPEKLSNTIKRIAKNTEGARGQISSGLANGTGHAFNWRIEGGAVKYYDTFASGKNAPVEDASFYISQYLTGKNGKITRLDGLKLKDLNLDYLKKYFDISSL